MFRSVHPSETAGRRIKQPHRYRASRDKNHSDVYRDYCKQCGQSIDIRRAIQGDGEANVFTLSSDGTYYNRTVVGGCPLCGTKNSI